ncbi:MAG TPA: cation transporter [Acidimicrobiales bacterium]
MSATTGDDEGDPGRQALLARALTLSYVSVLWGVSAGGFSIAIGLLAGSLGVLGLGLNTLADVAGSIGLVWRFGVERRDPARGHRAEARASVVVATGLSIVAVSLTVAAVNGLIDGSGPQRSVLAMASAGVSALVLAPLGLAKYRTGIALRSHALKGDGTLSGMGAALGVVALLALVADRLLGWWWADRGAALAVAVVAAGEAARVLRRRSEPAED